MHARRAVARGCDLDERNAGAIEEGVERCPHVLAGGLRDGGEKLVARGVAEAVRFEVGMDAATERVFADPALEHPNDAGPLLVGDAVEAVLDVVVGRDRLPDRARAREGVRAHRALHALEQVEATADLRVPHVADLRGGPRREGFVEPKVVPPGHRDQIAEPLVRELVGDDLTEPAELPVRRRLRVEEEAVLGEHDRARVLHRPLAIGDREEIEFVVRVGNAEVLLVGAKRTRTRPEPSVVRDASLPLEMASFPGGTTSVTSKGIFADG